MFNAWITKNIAYKVVSQTNKCCNMISDNDDNNNQFGDSDGFFPDYRDNTMSKV